MDLLRADGLTLVLGGEEVLRGVSLSLQAGQKLGLVGPNGSGKSTLLCLLAGRRAPMEGRVLWSPGSRVGYVSQEGAELGRGTVWEAGERALEGLRDLEAELREEEARLARGEGSLTRYGELLTLFEARGGHEAEGRLTRTLARFSFGEETLTRPVAALSGGERGRLALALALAAQPDALLLDEPSNHLDLPTRGELTAALAAFPGALILASHDRALLDAVTAHTAHLSRGHLTLYRGSYRRFREQHLHAALTQRRGAKRRAFEHRRLEAATHHPAGRRNRTLQARLARSAVQDEPIPTPTDRPLTLTAAPGRGVLLDARHLRLTVGGKEIVRDASLRLHAGEKLALVGRNGAGKSTLLGLLSGDLESEHPEASLSFAGGTKLAVFDQTWRGLAPGVPLREQLTRLVSEPRGRSLLALVGLGGTWDAPPERLSGGERARAGLVLLMASEANLLLLDEPSEHLDVATVEKLEAALQDTTAAVVLVSHDAALVEGVAERVLSLEDGELKEYRGGLAGFFKGTLRLDPDLPEPPQPPEAETDPEAELGALELERAELERVLEDPLLLTERDRERATARRREVLERLSELYDARLPPPGPAFETVEAGVRVFTDGAGSPLVFRSDAGLTVHLLTADAPRTGHLALREPEDTDACTLPWARHAALRGAVRLAFEHLGFRVLQTQTGGDLSAAGFGDAGGGWWVLSRADYERREGYPPLHSDRWGRTPKP